MTPVVRQFRDYILRPTLEYLQMPDSDRAELLLLGTAVHESAGLQFIRQVGPHRQDMTNGAYGIYQIEEATYKDVLHRFTGKYVTTQYYTRILDLVPVKFVDDQWPPIEYVMGDWIWATAVARIHFLLIRSRIPFTLENMAMYYKRYYNTARGKATPEDWLRHYKQFAEETKHDHEVT